MSLTITDATSGRKVRGTTAAPGRARIYIDNADDANVRQIVDLILRAEAAQNYKNGTTARNDRAASTNG